jgi:hypothetical protein
MLVQLNEVGSHERGLFVKTLQNAPLLHRYIEYCRAAQNAHLRRTTMNRFEFLKQMNHLQHRLARDGLLFPDAISRFLGKEVAQEFTHFAIFYI